MLFTSACVRNSLDFILLLPESTGVDFVNEFTESDSIDVSSHPFLYNGGGVAVGDINNDEWTDIMQVDMLPQSEEEREKTLINYGHSQYDKLKKLGYYPQYMYNTLQMNRGEYSDRNIIFSEISLKAGVEATGWSWAALFEDLNNDGYQDLLVTNGYPKNLISLGYFKALNNVGPFGTSRTREAKKKRLLEELESLKIVNKLFKNEGDHTFSDKSGNWGFDIPSYSYGAVASDLDKDGDLDLVINNLNSNAFIYQNQLNFSSNSSGNKGITANFSQVKIIGTDKNPFGIGSKLKLVAGDSRQYRYISPYRGYISSTDIIAHFGLGENDQTDSLIATWLQGEKSVLTNLPINQLITVQFSDEGNSESILKK